MIEKIEKLEEVRQRLKQDFIGIDDIIDRVIEYITPWYLTPEILERPVVISLWGLTGTGKTDLIRKLRKYLGVTSSSASFDCGELVGSFNGCTKFSDLLTSIFNNRCGISSQDYRYSDEEIKEFGILLNDERDEESKLNDKSNFIFIFDEFQHLKTKDDKGGEVDRPESRTVWNLIDSGIVDLNESDRELRALSILIEDLKMFNLDYPGVPTKEGYVIDSRYSKLLKNRVRYYRWTSYSANIMRDLESPEDDIAEPETEEREKSNTRYLRLLDADEYTYIIYRLNCLRPGLGLDFAEKLKNFKNLNELCKYLDSIMPLLQKPRTLDCSKSLIFILGNLDEAFNVVTSDNTMLDPDLDADIYHEITAKSTIIDVKRALRRRFRDEQIGRLGNNVIIYPTLKRADFEEVIYRELERISKKFLKTYGIKLTFDESINKLMYCESVYPILGVRPVLQSIQTMITPKLSEAMINKPEGTVEILFEAEENTQKEFTEIKMTFKGGDGSETVKTGTFKTTLGSLRDPEKCSKLYALGIHEASHAVVYSVLTGKFPSAIIASSLTGGGYMMQEISQDTNDIQNIEEFTNLVRVSLAGYCGEQQFFKKDKCTLGASSDMSSVWNKVSKAFLRCGYLGPIKRAMNTDTQENDSLPYGYTLDKDTEYSMKRFIEGETLATKRIISQEEDLIREMGKYLAVNRCMSQEVYKELISKYAATFSLESMEELRLENENYYKNLIEEK